MRTHDSAYQEFIAKNLQQKYNEVNAQMDNIIREANAEIESLRDGMTGMQGEVQGQQRKIHDLSEALQEKTKQNNKLQSIHEKLRRKSMIDPLQHAAAASIDAIAARDAEHTGSSTEYSQHWGSGFRQPISKPNLVASTSHHRPQLNVASRQAGIARRAPLTTLPHNIGNTTSNVNFLSTPRRQKSNSFMQASPARSSFATRQF